MLATLIRTTGDWDLAEECAQDAFARALERWPTDGVPRNPGAWLTTTARNRALDRLRRDAVGAAKVQEAAVNASADDGGPGRPRRRDRGRGQRHRRRPAAADLHLLPPGPRPRRPGRAHPAHPGRADHGRDRPRLPRPRADHGPAPGAGQAQDPPRRHPLPGAARPPAAGADGVGAGRRLPAVQRGLRGHRRRRPGAQPGCAPRPSAWAAPWPSSCPTSPRPSACSPSCSSTTPAGRAGSTPPASSSRSRTRTGRGGTGPPSTRAWPSLDAALRRGEPGPYQVQAAIAACHATAARAADTDWAEIAGLYRQLARFVPSPVVELNRAVAVAMADGPAAGLALVERLEASGAAGRLPPAPRHPGRPPAPPRPLRRGGRRLPRRPWPWPPTTPTAATSPAAWPRSPDPPPGRTGDVCRHWDAADRHQFAGPRSPESPPTSAPSPSSVHNRGRS